MNDFREAEFGDEAVKFIKELINHKREE